MTKPSGNVKGFLLAGLINILKGQRPVDGLKQLKKIYGGPIGINILRDYPYDQAEQLRDAVTKILFGGVSNKTLAKTGRLVWQLISQSPLGKTLTKLFGTNFKELAEQAPRFYEMIAPSGQYHYTDLGPTAYRIRYLNELSPPAFHVGIHQAAAGQFGIKPKIKIRKIDQKSFEIEVRW